MPSNFAIVIDKRPVKHFWKSRGGFLPIAIVERMIQGSIEDAELFFDGRKPEGVFAVSAHYAIARDGRVWQFVDDEDTAWSNGVLQNPELSVGWLKEVYQEKVNCNLVTLSIDYEGYSGEALTPEQYQAALALHHQLVQRWEIEVDDQHIIGHNWIDSLERSQNPGPAFPFDRLLKDLQVSAAAPAPASETAFSDGPLPATEARNSLPWMVETESLSYYQPQAVEEPAYRPQLDDVTFASDLGYEPKPVVAQPAEVDPATAEPVSMAEVFEEEEKASLADDQVPIPAWEEAAAPAEPESRVEETATEVPLEAEAPTEAPVEDEAPTEGPVEDEAPTQEAATEPPVETVAEEAATEALIEAEVPAEEAATEPPVETAPQVEQANSVEAVEAEAPAQEAEAATEAPVEAETLAEEAASVAENVTEKSEEKHHWYDKFKALFEKHEEAPVQTATKPAATAPEQVQAAPATEVEEAQSDTLIGVEETQPEPAIGAEEIQAEPITELEETQAEPATEQETIQAEPVAELEETQPEPAIEQEETQVAPAIESEEAPAEPAIEAEEVRAEAATELEETQVKPATEAEEIQAEAATEVEETQPQTDTNIEEAEPAIESEAIEAEPATESDTIQAETAADQEAIQAEAAIEVEETQPQTDTNIEEVAQPIESEAPQAAPAIEAEVMQAAPAIEAEVSQPPVQPPAMPVSRPVQPEPEPESFYPFELDTRTVSNHAAFYRSQAADEPAGEINNFNFGSIAPANSFDQDYDFQDLNGPSDYPFELPAAEVRPQPFQPLAEPARPQTFDTAAEKPTQVEETPPLPAWIAEPIAKVSAMPDWEAEPAAEAETPAKAQSPEAGTFNFPPVASHDQTSTESPQAATAVPGPHGFAYDDLELPSWLEEAEPDLTDTPDPAGFAGADLSQNNPGPVPTGQTDFAWASSPYSQDNAVPGWLQKPAEPSEPAPTQTAPVVPEQAATEAPEPTPVAPLPALKEAPAVALPNQDWQENLFEDDDFFSLLNQSGVDLNVGAPTSPAAPAPVETDAESGRLEPSAEEVSHFEQLLSESGASQPPVNPAQAAPAPANSEPDFASIYDEVEPPSGKQTLRQLIDRNDGYTAPLAYEDLDMSVPFGLEEDLTPPFEKKPLVPAQDRKDGLSFGEDFFEKEPFPVPVAPPAAPAPEPAPRRDPAGFNRVYLGEGVVSVELANIRSQPSYAKETVLKVAEQGERFEFDGWTEGPELRNSTRWYHITPADGNGWIHSTLVVLDRPFRV